MKPKERQKGRVRRVSRRKEGLSLSSRNYLIGGVGLLVIIVGYIFLAQPPVDSFWSLTLAPILLVLGYCVIVPISILYRAGSSKRKQGEITKDHSAKARKPDQSRG